MVTQALIDPKSIVIIGGSNDIHKPGGKVLKNLLDGGYHGNIYVTNPKENEVLGIKCYKDVNDLPEVDLAIMAIAARYIPDTVEVLARNKSTKGYIILSAGFSEESKEGKELEDKIVETINSTGGGLIGPNCIGVLTPEYHGVFTMPIPKLDMNGCDFISGSGATACFIMEAGIPMGLPFARVFSVGNSAQMGVEEILQYMDETYEAGKSPKVKLLYIENIDKPAMLLKHASSLIRKGCRIAAIKAGGSEAGSRAASSHTGALASSDVAVDALFKKAGIVRCYGREELISVASIFMYPELKGDRIAVITHAGGPAVMLTDALSEDGMQVPRIDNDHANELLEQLFPGSSVANPIDFLATGTAEQLGHIIDYCDRKFDEIDGMAVIFGTPGLFPIFDVYELLNEKMNEAKKPIFPILPSTFTANDEVTAFIEKGRVIFSDEVVFGKALTKVWNTPPPVSQHPELPGIDTVKIREVIDSCSDGYIAPLKIQALLDASGIPRVHEAVADDIKDAVDAATKLGYPVVMKAVGPVHKSDVGGVRLNIKDDKEVRDAFRSIMEIPETTSVLMQPMFKGIELFAGAKREEKFGHLVLCGLGGIFIEVLKDVQAGLCPIAEDEALSMLYKLQGKKILEGVRGQEGVDLEKFAKIITRISALLITAPEIYEMDLNPLIGNKENIMAVDARINIKKS
ncbi:MAG: acetate--CoA ligase family protein [Bacteroidales bacterium]|jgi:acetyltransferase|nr:acetate--CoA ligase family protein [Bacteroidales bacterium]